MKGYIKPLVAIVALLIFAADGMAESSTSSQDSGQNSASARIKLRVVIPAMLLFQVNENASSGDDLVLHGNTGPASIVAGSESSTETTYTAASL